MSSKSAWLFPPPYSAPTFCWAWERFASSPSWTNFSGCRSALTLQRSVLSVFVAVLSIRDAVVFYRTHDTAAMKVQLPKPIKLLIHSVIKDNLSSNKIVVGAIITGFIVTLLEGVCTAKIYLPTIVVMTKAVGFRLLGWLLLIFYNFLFVLPLLIVMIAAAYGLKWTRLSKFTQNHLALMKVLLALVLLALATFITMEK